jgi:CRP-like cAMP-binding protein
LTTNADPAGQADAGLVDAESEQLAESMLGLALFGGLPEAIRRWFAARVETITVQEEQAVFRENDAAREVYVVLDGELVVLMGAVEPVEMARLLPGDSFGEMSVIDMQRRSASVFALTPCRLLCLTSADMEALYRFDPKAYSLFVLNLAREISRKLRFANKRLAQLHRDA